jgi:DNA replication protein DnaC
VKFGADVAEALRELPQLTDEEWAERDAKMQADLEAEEAKRQALEDEATRVRVLAGGAPERAVIGAYADTFEVDAEAMLGLHDFKADERGIRILAGGVGSGKTWAAVRWLGEHGGGSPMFMRVSEFETISRYDKDHRQRWKNASALVLDDLGAEYADGKGNLMADLDELVDVYSGRLARLIITTNLTPAQFKARYSSRILSRLRAHARWKSLSGGDRRTK